MNLNQFIRLVFAMGILLPNALVAQSTFTLKACIDYGLDNHLSQRIYANDITAARHRAGEGVAGYLPQVNGTVSFDDNIKRQTSIIPGAVFGSPNDVKVQFGTQYNATASVQIDQAIYDHATMVSLQANRPNIELAKLKKEKNEEDIIYSIATSYYQVLTLTQQLNLLQENEKKYAETMRIMQLQFDKGVLKKVDLDRVKVTANNVTIQIQVAKTNLETAYNRLKYNMGMSLETALVVKDSLPDATQLLETPTSKFVVEEKLDYKIQNATLFLQKINLRRQVATYVPSINAYVRYGAQAFNNDISKVFDKWFDYATIGVKMNVPIFSGFRRYHQVRQTALTVSNAKLNLQLSKDAYALQAQNSNVQLLNAGATLRANTENLKLAQEVFDITSLQYQKGVASLSDFLNSDYAYKEAQTNYLNALFNYLTTRIDAERMNNNLKPYLEKF